MSENTDSESAQVQPSIPFESFTEQTRKVLELAGEEARSFNHNYIGTEHLLLGLIREGESLAATVLRNLSIDLSLVRYAIEHIIGRGPETVVGEIKFTARAVAVTAMARSEAFRVHSEYVAPEHLLLAIIREGEGIAVGVLARFGATREKVRAQTYQAIVASTPKSNVVTCRIDGQDLDAIDALIEAGIRTTRSDTAAWLIHVGIEANKELLEKVYGTVAEIRRLRAVAQALAQQTTQGTSNVQETAEGSA